MLFVEGVRCKFHTARYNAGREAGFPLLRLSTLINKVSISVSVVCYDLSSLVNVTSHRVQRG